MNITEQQAEEAVAQRWVDIWVPLHPTIAYFFENKKGAEPTDPDAFWARVALKQADSEQHTLGKPSERLYRREAAVWVNLYGPVNEGTKTILGLADDVRRVFEGASFDGVDSTSAGRVVKLGAEGRWFEVLVIIPVVYYEQR